MNRSVIYKIALITIISALWIVSLSAQAQETELLQNAGFEAPFTDRGGEIERRVAASWEPWHRPRSDTNESWRNRQPAYVPASEESPVRVYGGNDAQVIASEFLTHDGGVYQRVDGLTPNTQVTFSVYAYVWSTTYRDPEFSEEPGGVFIAVGIDPTGGTDFDSANIVWSTPIENYDGWNQYTVSATITGSAATVWVRSIVELPVQFSYIWLDDASLVAGAAVGGTDVAIDATPTPEGFEPETSTPTETATETIIIPVATNTELPTSTPEIVETDTVEPSATSTSTLPPTLEQPTNFPTSTDNPVVVITATPEVIVITATLEPTLEPTITPVVIVVTATEMPTNFPTETPTPTETATPTVEPSPTSESEVGGGIGGPLDPPLNEAFPGRIIHTVRRGDTVGALAVLYGSTNEAIIEANGLNENALIFVGQGLIIPVRIPNPATVTPTHTPLVPVATATPGGGGSTGGPLIGEVIYVVQPGDTLSRIATRYNTTVAAIAQLNGIVNPNLIRVGQQLRVPGTGGTIPPVQPTPQQPVPRTYVVQPGDTLFRISLRFGVPLSTLIQVNGIANPNRIYAGQVLTIP